MVAHKNKKKRVPLFVTQEIPIVDCFDDHLGESSLCDMDYEITSSDSEIADLLIKLSDNHFTDTSEDGSPIASLTDSGNLTDHTNEELEKLDLLCDDNPHSDSIKCPKPLKKKIHFIYDDMTFDNRFMTDNAPPPECEINTELRIKLCNEIKTLPSAKYLSSKYKLNEEIRKFDRTTLKYVNRTHYWKQFKSLFYQISTQIY